MGTTAANAANLFIADYSGNVTTAVLSTTADHTHKLVKTHETKQGGANPSWLTVNQERRLLYCVDEGLEAPNGLLTSFQLTSDGSLTHIQTNNTIRGPVSIVVYGHSTGRRALALAHYDGSSVSSWALHDDGSMDKLQDLTYSLKAPGLNPSRQEAPHPHEALLDPSGKFVLVPDLGADLVRVYAWDEKTLHLIEKTPLQATPGSGPRHGVFWRPNGADGPVYFYLVGELDSIVRGYAVKYGADSEDIVFEEVSKSSTFGLNPGPQGNAPAEISLSPDNRFLIISNRNDNSFTSDNGQGHNRRSDSLATFKLGQNGELDFLQLASAGGRFPRHFSLNAEGSLLAVGLQMDKLVLVLKRDPVSGLIGEITARLGIEGDPVCVVWDEN